jgi:hypothetical protein
VGSDGSTAVLDVPELEVEAKVSAAPVSNNPPEPDTPADKTSKVSTQTVLGWSAVGLGAVGLGVGVAFELKRSSKLRSRDAICASGDPAQCPPGSQAQVDELTSEARTAGTVGAVGLIAGGVLAAGGVVLLLTAPKHGSTEVSLAPALGPQFQGLLLSGRMF